MPTVSTKYFVSTKELTKESEQETRRETMTLELGLGGHSQNQCVLLHKHSPQ